MEKSLHHSLFSDFDVYLFRSGKHRKLYKKFGAHEVEVDGRKGVYFAVYAPAARDVEVIGNFNGWDGKAHKLFVRWDGSGIWEGFIPGLGKGELYKYRIYSSHDQRIRDKPDPYSFFFEQAPKTSGIIWEPKYAWKDEKWMQSRKKKDLYKSAVSIYEVHLGSWKKDEKAARSLHYPELADELVAYVSKMGFTHVEFLPVTEHPYYPSWGYLSTGFFAPTSRYGTPEEFMYLVDAFHQAGIGVILDWVPAHFPSDTDFLADFDGSALFEHPNPKKGYHPDWDSLIFNFDRPEICSFLISSARFWLEVYHIDGLRVDAVASMIYLDYSREEGQWDPNIHGGKENLEAIAFLKELNKACYDGNEGIMMIAEESTAFPGVTSAVHDGGLGFGFKWMMGWMNDTLRYMARDPIFRRYHHGEISFSMVYAYSENYILPFSHDEVVHGKASMIHKMPGDDWKRFAGLRGLYGYMFTHPGHKLLFMGNEFAQRSEWNFNASLQWDLLKHDTHKGIQKLVKDLNNLLQKEKALSESSFNPGGFEWIDHSDYDNSVIAYVRKSGRSTLLVVCNFTPRVHRAYRLGVPKKGVWRELLNTDDEVYGGSGVMHDEKIATEKIKSHGRNHSVEVTLAPLATMIFKYATR